jgi:hypothetical protein
VFEAAAMRPVEPDGLSTAKNKGPENIPAPQVFAKIKAFEIQALEIEALRKSKRGFSATRPW